MLDYRVLRKEFIKKQKELDRKKIAKVIHEAIKLRLKRKYRKKRYVRG